MLTSHEETKKERSISEDELANFEGFNYLAQMRPEDIWMLAVDGKFYKEEKGPIGFDAREPKSVAGILKGIITAIGDIENPLSVETIVKIYSKCVDGVSTRNKAEVQKLRSNDVTFVIVPNWYSKEGLAEFLEEKNSGKIRSSSLVQLTAEQSDQLSNKFEIPSNKIVEYKDVCKHIPFNDLKCVVKLSGSEVTTGNLADTLIKLDASELILLYQAPSYKDIEKQCQKIIALHNNNMKVAKNRDDILSVIVSTVKELCKAHPFKDANNRTFINCILNVMLMKHGFSFVLLYDPNVFEFHTVTQLVDIVKKGMATSQDLIGSSEKPIYGFKSSEIPASKQSEYTALGKILLSTVSIKINSLGANAFRDNKLMQAVKYFKLAYKFMESIGESKSKNAVACFNNLTKATQRLASLSEVPQDSLAAHSMFKQLDLSSRTADATENIKESKILSESKTIAFVFGSS